METLTAFLASPISLVIWAALVIPSETVLLADLRRNNAHLMSLMKLVWALTVLYSGPIGLLIYWSCGRKEISTDSLPRRAFRSVAHCYSGCGLGEVTGLMIAVGLLQLSTPWVAGITFALAYVAGFALTVGPLMQDGVGFNKAMWDALLAETPSITVMEIVAIGTDLTLSGNAGIADPLFWSSMVVSLTCGLVAAWPVNLLLIRYGVKEGMMDPRNTGHAHG
ncbi:DUF4396 domain-containing protein [Roseovarius indicus]|uniref:Multicopper oxidase n=1 Tax=Roseovarius indicus TaxID=540747 RepID=A0A0T5PEJ9_9RHOB|nr:DUF4396 domain-containing protein [Roseovarius indicus]KRS19468.1 multicopper oxidase [Roseovarius indicus]QEW29212.1 hypothetical protein RIdsm_05055 [Roseovarius indicus]SFD77870.1 protein of unknown function [Roseovarius indicus]